MAICRFEQPKKKEGEKKMSSACSGKRLTVDEIKNIKLLLSNGFDISEICQRTKRSYTSIVKVRDGLYDFCLDNQEAKKDAASDSDIDTVQAILSLENEVASTLMCISKKATEKTDEISAALLAIAKAIDRNTEAQLQANLIAAKNNVNVKPYESYVHANKEPEGQPEQIANKTTTEAEFLKWNEVVRRAAAISDKTTEKVMKRTTATMKGSSIYVQCDDTDKKYFLTHGAALETLRKQASNICGYSVKIGLA